MFDDAMDFISTLLIILVTIIGFIVVIEGYVKPLFLNMYYQAPMGIKYSTYSSIINYAVKNMKWGFFIVIGGIFLFFLYTVFYKEETIVYQY